MITDLLLIFIIIVLLANIYIRQMKCEKSSFELIKILNSNVVLLSSLEKRKKIQDLKNSLKINTELQVILKISNCDFLSLFKYDFHSKQKLHYLVSLDKNGSVVQSTLLDNYIVSDSIENFGGDDELVEIKLMNVKSKKIADIMSFRGVNKLYCQNISEIKNKHIGFLALSYKDINYNLSDGDKFEIQRIAEEIGRLI